MLTENNGRIAEDGGGVRGKRAIWKRTRGIDGREKKGERGIKKKKKKQGKRENGGEKTGDGNVWCRSGIEVVTKKIRCCNIFFLLLFCSLKVSCIVSTPPANGILSPALAIVYCRRHRSRSWRESRKKKKDLGFLSFVWGRSSSFFFPFLSFVSQIGKKKSALFRYLAIS